MTRCVGFVFGLTSDKLLMNDAIDGIVIVMTGDDDGGCESAEILFFDPRQPNFGFILLPWFKLPF